LLLAIVLRAGGGPECARGRVGDRGRQSRPTVGETWLYAWWAVGATALAAWGVADKRSERVNMATAIFTGTVIAFYFSHVMDKIGRSASLIGLGLLFLAGGFGIEQVRRRLVSQARGGQA
jgi:uncharacterized membrane protein